MKKQRKVSLALNKKTVSSLRVNSVTGGLDPTGVSACLACIEDPTDGCGTNFTFCICPTKRPWCP